MHFSTAIVLAGVAGLAATLPVENIKPRELAAFPAGTTFDINLNQGDSKASPQVGVANVAAESCQAVDIDLFDTDASTIADLKNSKIVVCYFSAGSREDWRPDANLFGEGDTGQGLDGWADETWVNVTSENVRSIMQKRIELAAQKGCSAIDPDNVDGFVCCVSLPSHGLPSNKLSRAKIRTASVTTWLITSTMSNSCLLRLSRTTSPSVSRTPST